MRDRKQTLDNHWKCAEKNQWTPVTVPSFAADERLSHLLDVDASRDPLELDIADVDSELAGRVHDAKGLSFHAVGCTGDPGHPEPQDAVAAAMVKQLFLPTPPSFFFHLGDIVYKNADHEGKEDVGGTHLSQKNLYDLEFYQAYSRYSAPIFAIPGNHDRKYKKDDFKDPDLEKSPMAQFLQTFCAPPGARLRTAGETVENDAQLPAQRQPYPYFALLTPAAILIGLDANAINGGCLDDPEQFRKGRGPQFQWLIGRLQRYRDERNGRALILLVHYPPYSAAANFRERGDVRCPLTKGSAPRKQLAEVLQEAFREADEWPDLILSSHAHQYQRLTYFVQEDGKQRCREIPCVIAGCGGHASEVGLPEPIDQTCMGEFADEIQPGPVSSSQFPKGLNLPKGDYLMLNAYNDQDFGFVRISVDLDTRCLSGEYIAVYPTQPLVAAPGYVRPRHDAFRIHLDRHALL